MKKITVNSIISLLFGLIIFLLGIILQKLDNTIEISTISASALCLSFITYLILQPFYLEKIKYYFNEIDWAECIVNFYQSIPVIYRKSFWLTFLFVNIAFLFHTIHFMWGAFDWEAIRFNVNTQNAINQGRFSAYALQNLLFDGKILPVINNLWSFIGLSLGGILLAYYWELPKKVSTYTVTALFFAITPYTLGWLYHTQNTLGNLWLPAFILTSLIISQKATNSLNKSYLQNLIAITLLIITLGTYFASINFIGVVILGKIFLSVATQNLTVKDVATRQLQGLANLTASILIYTFIIILLKYDSSLQTHINITPPTSFAHFSLLFSSMLKQFVTPYPFIDITYKTLTLLLALVTIFTTINKANNPKSALTCLLLLPLILISSRITCLFTYKQVLENQVLQDFYTLPILYTLFIALLLKVDTPLIKRFAYGLSILLIFMSFVRIAYALKVWKFGFDAELKLSERIITRLEKMPTFNIEKKYQLLQIGKLPMRSRYYINQNNEKNNELLNFAYFEPQNSSHAFNFFYQTDFLENNVSLFDAIQNKEIENFIMQKAKAWPHKDSIFIKDEYIVIIMDYEHLYDARQKIANKKSR
ncbi:MAG: hypothetical protein IKW39_03475 [Alphaproteobacteria bacterium]|nr:hypothetical protein [Alphaproteobacteria bacterium]